MENKTIFKKELHGVYDDRELESMWRILREDIFSSKGYARINEVIERLKKHEPIQHITGIQYFYGKIFKVNEHVLIPRSETEELVLWVLNDHDEDELNVLDIGTGSGCIACTLKLYRKNWNVSGMDISSNAIDVAKENGRQLDADVSWILGDMIDANNYPKKLDVVICNPPYVLDSDLDMMSTSVKLFEPHMALYVDSDDPLYYYRSVLEQLNKLSRNPIEVYFEIHHLQADNMCDLAQKLQFSDVEVRRDLQGHQRMIRLRRS